MTTTIQESQPVFDFYKLLKAADEAFGEVVDFGMFGGAITRANVLLSGAYGPAVRRLLTLVMDRYAGRAAEFGRAQLVALAPEAFAGAEDRDFGGNVMTDYSIFFQEEYGYGPTTLKLAQLALARQAEFYGPAARA